MRQWRVKDRQPRIDACVLNADYDDNCLDLFRRFKLVKEIAEDVGGFGVIYEVFNVEQEHRRAVKAVQYVPFETENEVYIICALQDAKAPYFIGYYSSWVCDDAPSDWLESTDRRSFTDKIAYIEMDRADGSLFDLLFQVRPQFTSDDFRSIIFEILFGLQFARTRVGLTHNDLKFDNILYTMDGKRELELSTGEKVRPSSVYKPLIIDFGRSKLAQITTDAGESQDFKVSTSDGYILDQQAVRAMMRQLEQTYSNELGDGYRDVMDALQVRDVLDLEPIMMMEWFQPLFVSE